MRELKWVTNYKIPHKFHYNCVTENVACEHYKSGAEQALY